MSTNLKSRDFSLPDDDALVLSNLAGPLDEHLRHIEMRLGISIANRGGVFRVRGEADMLDRAERLIRNLYDDAQRGKLTPHDIHLAITESGAAKPVDDLASQPAPALGDDYVPQEVVVRIKKGTVRGRSANQAKYLHAIATNDLNFGIGPAGTGKTYLAVAMAVEALNNHRVQRLVLVRPAVEAGEKLGFLPGDLSQKVDPYLRPLYDALYEMMGLETVNKLLERNVIEVAPLAYMRGRTLNDAFIILDEAQNTTIEQMKMFLTRIGFGSTTVVTGDLTQTDLPRHQKSGMKDALSILRGIEGVSMTFFESKDVVRHPLVARIIRAYDKQQHDKDAAKPSDDTPSA